MGSSATGKADSGLVLSNVPGPRGWRGLSRLPATALGMTPPPGLVLLSILSIQVGAALAIGLFPALGASGTVFVRVGFSAILLLVVTRLPLHRRLWDKAGLILLFGAIMATMNLCFYRALARIPLGIAVTIEFLGPLAVAVATSRRLQDFLWIGLAVCGVGLLTPDIGKNLDPVGVLFAAMAGTGWASFVLVSGRVGRAFPGGSGLALGMAVAALFLAPFGALNSGPVFSDMNLLLVALGVALLSTTIPLTLEFEALKRLPPRTYGVLITLEPVVAVMIGVILLGETLGLRTAFAVTCVTVAAIGATLTRGKS